MLSHRARFLLGRDQKGAQEAIKRAMELAETGGHEDVRHHCNLISIRFSARGESTRSTTDEKGLWRLDEIDAYAVRMSMWNLQCDAVMQRETMLLEQGETTTAGRLLMRAIAIARRRSMGLRLNRATTLYAHTLLRRGDRRGACQIASSSLEMAKFWDYNLETSRAQRVLTEAESDSAPDHLQKTETGSIIF
jgi:hypothetical protein